MSKTENLSMIDRFGGRTQIIPAEVKGKFRNLRNLVHGFLLLIFLGLPWLRVGAGQAVLLDIPGRRFEVFGQVFLSHDSPLIFFILILAALLIMLTTALWGRVWCGWACPQTVFIDFVFRKIEILTQGRYIQRRQLSEGPLTAQKILKSGLKWFLFFVVSSVIAHSFIAYFTGSRELVEMMGGNPAENWNYFLMVTSVSALVLFNFGWFREQFCILVCPYGRFQGVLTDSHSVVIAYDEKRGEPRKGVSSASRGDCVSCNRCVQVCPTGIDIRNGLQMECIACTACIDACDEIMRKVKKPEGLISYSGGQSKKQFLRPRILGYVAMLVVAAGGLTYILALRLPFSAVLLRGSRVPFELSPEKEVINHFKVHLHNQSHRPQVFHIVLAENASVKLSPDVRYELAAEKDIEVHLFLRFPQSVLNKKGVAAVSLVVQELQSGEWLNLRTNLAGPQTN